MVCFYLDHLWWNLGLSVCLVIYSFGFLIDGPCVDWKFRLSYQYYVVERRFFCKRHL